MGFGVLIFGYFLMFAFSISRVYFFADIIGTVVVIYAFSKLAQYNRYFSRAMVCGLVFMLLCAVDAVALMFSIKIPDMIDMGTDICKLLAACLMHIPMYLGIRGISEGAGSDKLIKLTMRNLALTMTYYTSAVAVLLLKPVLGESTVYISTVVWIFDIVCIFINLVLFYKCFAILCPADEDETVKKRSRFGFINKINDKLDSIDDERQRYREESMKLAMSEANRRASEKNNNKKRNHKHKK